MVQSGSVATSIQTYVVTNFKTKINCFIFTLKAYI